MAPITSIAATWLERFALIALALVYLPSAYAEAVPSALVVRERPLADTDGFPELPEPTPDERHRLSVWETEGRLKVAEQACATFNPGTITPFMTKIDAWRARQGTILRARPNDLAHRVGYVAMHRIRYGVSHSLADRLSINKATKAGCAEFLRLLDKL